MQIASIQFLVALALLAAVHAALPGARARSVLLGFAALGFASFQFQSRLAWLAVGGFTVSGYAAALLLRKRPSAWGLGLYSAALVLIFVYLKNYDFVRHAVGSSRVFPVELVGLSYMLFKQIHTVVDCAQGQVPRLTLGSYLLYQFNFLTLLAGPIQRYQDFVAQLEASALATRAADIVAHWQRVLTGILKILLSTFVLAFCNQRVAYLMDVTRPLLAAKEFALVFYSYPVYVYVNFSGYTDAVIGAGRLLGFDLPENFNRPYLARNMLDFWNRWHITLSHWVRDYIFTPGYMSAASAHPARAKQAGYACLFLALFVAGIWHGPSVTYVVFGLIHGIGVSVNRMTEDYIVGRYRRAGLKAYLANAPIRAMARVMTLHYVCLSFLFFRPDIHQNLQVIRRVWGALT